jgi:hypothetical protein
MAANGLRRLTGVLALAAIAASPVVARAQIELLPPEILAKRGRPVSWTWIGTERMTT